MGFRLKGGIDLKDKNGVETELTTLLTLEEPTKFDNLIGVTNLHKEQPWSCLRDQHELAGWTLFWAFRIGLF